MKTDYSNTKLFIIKLMHTLIWAAMAACVIFTLIAGIFVIDNGYVYASIIIILGEGIILLIFKWKCPLTVVAQKYTDNRRDNFDIFLPNYLARHNKAIFTTLFIIGLMLIILRKVFHI